MTTTVGYSSTQQQNELTTDDVFNMAQIGVLPITQVIQEMSKDLTLTEVYETTLKG